MYTLYEAIRWKTYSSNEPCFYSVLDALGLYGNGTCYLEGSASPDLDGTEAPCLKRRRDGWRKAVERRRREGYPRYKDSHPADGTDGTACGWDTIDFSCPPEPSGSLARLGTVWGTDIAAAAVMASRSVHVAETTGISYKTGGGGQGESREIPAVPCGIPHEPFPLVIHPSLPQPPYPLLA